MPGIKLVVGDADALIALANKADALHDQALAVATNLMKLGAQIVFPNTAIAEAITASARRDHNKPVADHLLKKYQQGEFTVEYVDEHIMKSASVLFDPYGNVKDTFHDAIVAATAKRIRADAIFSFDNYYAKKLGLSSASDLLPK